MALQITTNSVHHNNNLNTENQSKSAPFRQIKSNQLKKKKKKVSGAQAL
jgi:hypothetical protein